MALGNRILCVIILASCASATKVTFKNNGYENILVSISDNTPRKQADDIIHNIKKMFNDASPVLHVATTEKAYIRSVHILIPESWKDIEANETTWENSKEADIKVEVPDKSSSEKIRAYVRQPRGCGEPGEFMFLSTDYLVSSYDEEQIKTVGKPGKVFVHEWAHYRYGVFDEYGDNSDKYPMFYKPAGSQKIVPNLCFNKPASFSLYDVKTNSSTCTMNATSGIWDKNCRFVLNSKFTPDTSLSSVTSLESITGFCQSDQSHRHVYDARTKHNEMCGALPVLDVIMRHEDFKNAKKVTLPGNEVQFRIVRPSPITSSRSRFVLVADVSYCMKHFDRFEKLQEAARSWIKYDLPTGSELAIVTFSSYAHIITELTAVADNSRDWLISKIPNKMLSGKSCIGCGLMLGAQLLNETGYGGVMVLITNSIEDGYIKIHETYHNIIEAGIRVVTITFGQGANCNLEKLVDLSDGKSYLVQDYETCEAVKDAFVDSMTLQHSVPAHDLRVKLFENLYAVDIDETEIEDCFDVDFDVGRNLQLVVASSGNTTDVKSIKLTGPDDQTLELMFTRTANTTVSASVPMIEEGRWRFTVQLEKEQSTLVLITVSSQTLPDSESPIFSRCWVPNGAYITEAESNAIKVYAEVLKGSNPVIGAAVKAYIEKPDATIEVLELLDDGKGADGEENDGFYARYFTKATQPGRYSVKCQVIGNQATFETLGFIGSKTGDFNLHDSSDSQQRVPLAPFSRVIAAGSFQLETPLSEIDAYPPSRVSDLSAHLINWTDDTAAVQLRWTAPGDELDSGIVTRYELKYSFEVTRLLGDSFEDSVENWPLLHDNVLSGSLEPVEAGSQQQVVILLSEIEKGKPYFIGVRAVDKVNKVGRVSNMGTFFVPDSTISVESTAFNDESSETNQYSFERPQGVAISVAIGIFLSLVLFGCLITFVVFVVRRMTPYKIIPA